MVGLPCFGVDPAGCAAKSDRGEVVCCVHSGPGELDRVCGLATADSEGALICGAVVRFRLFDAFAHNARMMSKLQSRRRHGRC
jgi:hypothetical protein